MRIGEWWTFVALGALCMVGAGCGRTSRSLGALPSETDAAGSSGHVTNGGAGSLGGKGGGDSVGAAGDDPFAQAGSQGGPCVLSADDCASAREPQCTGNAACLGAVSDHSQFGNELAGIEGIAAGPGGRIAITGWFQGNVDFGGQSAPLVSADVPSPQEPTGDAFVASFNAAGVAEWAYAYGGPGSQGGIDLAFAPNGDVVVQAGTGVASNIVARLDAQGHPRWTKTWGDGRVRPFRVATDSFGNAWLGGWFEDSLVFDGTVLTAGGDDCGYLIQIDENGVALRVRRLRPVGWLSSRVNNIAVDANNNLIILGEGQRRDNTYAAFVERRSPNEQVLFTKQLYAEREISVLALAVSGTNILVAGNFGGRFESDGQTFDTLSDGATDLWLASYAQTGELRWQRRYSSDGHNANVRAATIDHFGNVIVAGGADHLTIEDTVVETPPGPPGYSALVLKLRPDGKKVWVRSVEGDVLLRGVATNDAGEIWLAGAFAQQISISSTDVVSDAARQGLLLKLTP